MKHISLIWAIIVLFTLMACQPQKTDETIDAEDLIELTLEELSYYDGKEGRPAYIAVNGDIYDVTNSIFWQLGMHNSYAAGQDLTDPIINESPHGIAYLSRVPLIGRIKNGD